MRSVFDIWEGHEAVEGGLLLQVNAGEEEEGDVVRTTQQQSHHAQQCDGYVDVLCECYVIE